MNGTLKNSPINNGLAPATPSGETDSWNLATIVADLRAQRERWRHQQQRDPEHGGRELPSRDALREIAMALCGVLFPMRLGPSDLRQDTEDFYIGHTLDTAFNALLPQVQLELNYASRHGSLLHKNIEN